MSYKPKPLPALEIKAERQVGDELRRISRELDSLQSKVLALGGGDEGGDTGSGSGGWGGYSVDAPNGINMSLVANGGWRFVDTGSTQDMNGESGVTTESDGSLLLPDEGTINRVTVHANIYMDSADANLTDAVKMHIARKTDSGTLSYIGGLTRTKWAASDATTDFFANLNCSIVDGAVDGFVDFNGYKFYVQLSQTGSTAITVRIRSMQFWLEYS